MVTARVWQYSPGMAWVTSLVHVAVGLIGLAVGVLLIATLGISGGIASPIGYVLGTLSILAASQYLLAGVKSIFAQRPIGLEARNRACDTCMKCGYELSGMPDDEGTCPECGARYVKSVEPWFRVQRRVQGHLAARARERTLDQGSKD